MENLIQQAITNYDLSDIVNQAIILMLLSLLFGAKLLPIRIQFKSRKNHFTY